MIFYFKYHICFNHIQFVLIFEYLEGGLVLSKEDISQSGGIEKGYSWFLLLKIYSSSELRK